MATSVSIPSILHTALRNVEYVFSMPSVGVPPEEKFLRYRLLNNTDSVYLTDWKFYKPVTDGQNIRIDFYKDLFEVVSTPPPPFATPNVVVVNNTILKSIAVEYGERTVNTETCEEPVDTLDGTTNSVDVINGIKRVYEGALSLTGSLLTNRPKYYSVKLDTYDWLYLDGTITIQVFYRSETGDISNLAYMTTQVHPNAIITIVPIGFQNAPSGTTQIEVRSPSLVTVDNPLGTAFTLFGNACGCENGEPKDVYFQNQYGAIDVITFDCVDTKQLNIAKQYMTKRYDKGDTAIRTTGQKRTTRNNSFPVLTLKKQFEELTYEDSKWLDECAAASNLWMRETLPDGTDVLIRMNIVDGAAPTYGEEVEFILQLQYSEEFIYPY